MASKLLMTVLPSVNSGDSFKFIMSGIDGPNTSASSNPISSFGCLNAANAVARLTKK